MNIELTENEIKMIADRRVEKEKYYELQFAFLAVFLIFTTIFFALYLTMNIMAYLYFGIFIYLPVFIYIYHLNEKSKLHKNKIFKELIEELSK